MQVLTLLDATGSMAGNESRVVDGFREYLKVLAENPDTAEAEVTLATFNSATNVRFLRNGEAAKACRPLDWGEYRCEEVTPLYDAIAETIGMLERRATDGEKVVFVINTDGLENASQRETRDSIFQLIEAKKKAGWQFVFLGANLDAWAAKDQMGLTNIGLAASYSSNDMPEAISRMAHNTVRYAVTNDSAHLTAGFADSAGPRMGQSVGDLVWPTAETVGGVGVTSAVTLSPDVVAAQAGITPEQLARMRHRGKGPAYSRVGHRTVRYTQRDVDDWLAAAKKTTGD